MTTNENYVNEVWTWLKLPLPRKVSQWGKLQGLMASARNFMQNFRTFSILLYWKFLISVLKKVFYVILCKKMSLESSSNRG